MSVNPPLIEAITRSMHYLGTRQKVIAENIANSETPHYKAREVTAPDFADLLSRQTIRTGATHIARPQVNISDAMIAMGASRPKNRKIVEDHETSETKSDGNNVTLEDQLLKIGEIRADFTAMTNLYRKQLAMLNTALGRNG